MRPAGIGAHDLDWPGGFEETPALQVGIEHFQGAAAGVDLIVMGQTGEPFEDGHVEAPYSAPRR